MKMCDTEIAFHRPWRIRPNNKRLTDVKSLLPISQPFAATLSVALDKSHYVCCIKNRKQMPVHAKLNNQLRKTTEAALIPAVKRWSDNPPVWPTHRRPCGLCQQMLLDVFYTELSPGRPVLAGTKIPESERRGRLFSTLHCHRQNDSAFRWAAG